MDSNMLIFVAVAVALLAILYFAWPRKKAEPPRVEAPAETVTPVVPVDPALQAASELGADKASETLAAAPPKPKAAPKPKAESKTKPAPQAREAKAAPVPEASAVTPKAKAAPEKAAPATVPTEVTAKAKVSAAPAAARASPSIPDDIALLKGVGPKLVALLQSMGITSLAQIAAWSPADISEIDAKLGAFAGRINRDNWVDQAKLLTSGDIAAFEKKYGSLGSEIKKA